MLDLIVIASDQSQQITSKCMIIIFIFREKTSVSIYLLFCTLRSIQEKLMLFSKRLALFKKGSKNEIIGGVSPVKCVLSSEINRYCIQPLGLL